MAVRSTIALWTLTPGQLPLNGMTAAESAATKAFEAKPVALRLAMVEMGKGSLGAHRKDKCSKTVPN